MSLPATPGAPPGPTARNGHYSGWYSSSTTGGHPVYESRLELARLLLADADSDVVGSAQPFRLIESDDSQGRRHVPDFFLQHRSGTCTVVNVKPGLKSTIRGSRRRWSGRAR